MSGIIKVCGTCGSENVKLDAWAEWDAENQMWSLGATFDHAICDDCDGECKIVDRPYMTSEIPAGYEPVLRDDGSYFLALHTDDDWHQFLEENLEAIQEAYPTIDACYQAAREGGIVLGGGAAPIFEIRFVDSED